MTKELEEKKKEKKKRKTFEFEFEFHHRYQIALGYLYFFFYRTHKKVVGPMLPPEINKKYLNRIAKTIASQNW